MSASTSYPKMLVLVSSDKETFEVEEAVMSESQTIKHMIEDGCADKAIPLANVASKVLSKVIEFCRRHHSACDDTKGFSNDTTSSNSDLKAFDSEFLKVDQNMLFDLILAANYLNIQSLLDLTCQDVANKMIGKTPEEIRKYFNIVNDYTTEEEAEVRRENAWAFE